MAFAKAIIGKTIAITPIAHSFARKLACLDPCYIASDRRGSVADFKLVLGHLVKCGHLKVNDVDLLLQQFDAFTEREVDSSMCSFQNFNFRVDRLDTFMVEHLGCNDDLGILWSVVKSLFILSYGRATVEKGFSINRQILMQNMKEASFVAHHSIHDHMVHIGGINNLIVTKELPSFAGSGRKWYMDYLDEIQTGKESQCDEQSKQLTSGRCQ
ncbi:hypothetical protein LSH36_330g09009 [Paralvinella palmiformis]|uniref:Uncharacterized protein n=1 Tax=Paralvinella palmiformis TaxID=53620 RepID=A0AAD9N1W1_9ANNE|nr:hypothetical protein LSH36_330g09009 [Paralvinella palmiformis]